MARPLNRHLDFRNTKTQSRPRSVTVRRLLAASLLLAAVVAPSAPFHGNHVVAASTAASTVTLATPQGVQAQPDDRATILTWQPVAGAAGYTIIWGPAAAPAAQVAETDRTTIELQPLVNGQPYVATVQAVDNGGHLAPPSAPLSFTGDSSRVDALRQQMTGFFDDFNTPQGALDPRKWAQAFSYCAGIGLGAQFVNAQSHAHQLTGSGPCDRNQVVMRPRAQLDLSNGATRTIAWDMDGVFRRNQWYLDVTGADVDIDGHTGDYLGAQTNFLRIDQTGQGDTVAAIWMDANAHERQFASASISAAIGTALVPNVRHHWVVTLSQTHLRIAVDGHTVIDTSLTDTTQGLPAGGLPFAHATLLNALFSYNQHKEDLPATLMHEDNFGFDGPAPTVETHDYQDAGYYSGADDVAPRYSTVTVPITIPDSLVGAVAARLRFVQYPDGDGWDHNGDAPEHVYVNGTEVPYSVPTCPGRGSTSQCYNYNTPYAYTIPLDPALLHSGVNTVAYTMNQSHLRDTHLEVDFPAGHAPAYTPPTADALAPVTAVGDVGPSLQAYVNGQIVSNVGTLWENRNTTFPVSGIATISWRATNEAALEATGKEPGVGHVQVLVDGQVVSDQRSDADVPAPTTQGSYALDTTGLTDGPHTVLVRAYNPNGTLSIPDYFQAATGVSMDWPIALTVTNGASAGPTWTPAPANPTAMATSTATTPANPAPPVVTATNTPPPLPAATNTAPALPPTSVPNPSATPAPQVTAQGQVTTAQVAPGAMQGLTATVSSNTTIGTVIVDQEVWGKDASGAWQKVCQQAPTATLQAGQPLVVGAPCAVPANAVPGSYMYKVGVFDQGWSHMYAWNDNAASFTVNTSVTPTATAPSIPVPPTATATNTPVPPTATATATSTPIPPTATATNTPVPPTNTATNTPVPPTATATATATSTSVPPTAVPPTATATNTPPPLPAATNTVPALPPTSVPNPSATPAPQVTAQGQVTTAQVAPGAMQGLTATVSSNTTIGTVIVDQEVWGKDASGAWQKVCQQAPTATLQAGQPLVVGKLCAVPANAVPGSYVYKVGVFNQGWSHMYAWNDNAASFTVASAAVPTATPRSKTAATATPSPTTAPHVGWRPRTTTSALTASVARTTTGHSNPKSLVKSAKRTAAPRIKPATTNSARRHTAHGAKSAAPRGKALQAHTTRHG